VRILIANEALVGSGGVESYLAALLPALAGRRHDVALLHANTRHERGGTRLDRPDLPLFGVADEGLEAALAQARAWRPDVCFSHNLRQLDVEARLLAEWPVVKMMHGYFGTCVSGQKAHASPDVVPCTRALGAACLALYLPRHCGQYRPLKMFRQYGWALRQEQLLARYAAIVVASGHMAAEYRRQGVAARRLTVAPLFPTTPDSSTPRPRPAIPSVLFAGRMTTIKGGHVLVRAAAIASAHLARPLRLIMAGDGPERQQLEALASSLGVDATFTGWIHGDERTSLFRAATVVAVPSLWPEPFGLAGLEAASHGIPAVAFDVGGIREWLHDGVNGTLVAAHGSAESFARALAAMVANDDELGRMEAGALCIATKYSVDAHLDAIEPVLAHAARPRSGTAQPSIVA
jgi:glycosyltransferase involved in cell wall biosynthesis